MKPIIIKLKTDADFTKATPVAVPLGKVVSLTRTMEHQHLEKEGVTLGIWECTPGTWRRQVLYAEYSYIISGRGSFTPDGEDTIEFQAGDAIYFTANSAGIWDIHETVRKHYFIMG